MPASHREMRAHYTINCTQEVPARALLDNYGTTADLPDMLPQADIIMVAASQDARNRNMVNADFLRHCKCAFRHHMCCAN